MQEVKPRGRLLVGVVAVIAGAGVYLTSRVPTEHALKRQVSDPLANVPKSKDDLEAFVKRNKVSDTPAVQDQVKYARLKLGYQNSKQRDWNLARSTFLAATTHPGTGQVTADYGSLTDQAAYQAVVCLVAENKLDRAAHEFREFIKDRPLSPLCKACFVRLQRLKVETPADEALLQSAIDKQQAHIRFETSVCGPKTIEYLLPKLGKPGDSYKSLAKVCGTTDAGTTLEGVRKGFKAHGVQSFAYRLNRQDLARIPLPAILLQQDHYVALLKVGADKATVYDSRLHSESEIPLPALSDPDFTVNAILFSPLSQGSL